MIAAAQGRTSPCEPLQNQVTQYSRKAIEPEQVLGQQGRMSFTLSRDGTIRIIVASGTATRPHLVRSLTGYNITAMHIQTSIRTSLDQFIAT